VDPKKFRDKHGPEYKIQKAVIRFLEDRGWHVERLIGNQLQTGIPDIFLMHPKHGTRWVDIKVPGGGNYTKAQIAKWPVWEKHGCGVWILTAATEEEYDKLFQPANMRDYWRDRYNLPTIDELTDELLETK